jgi:hypothetical protein
MGNQTEAIVKIQFNTTKQLAGAMIVVLVMAVIIASTLAAYLLMVQNDYTQVRRSQTWNSSIVLAESGLEEGMAMINMYVGIGGFSQVTNWTARASANGWTDVYGDSTVWKKDGPANLDGNGGSYTVWITNQLGSIANITNPIIVAVGTAQWNVGVASAARPMFAQTTLLPTTQSQVTREVYVQTSWQPLFPGTMTTITNIDLAGGTVIDSFDSSDPNYSDWVSAWGWGTYDFSKHKANGNVYTDSSLAPSNKGAAITGGQNTMIYGHVDTGAGGGIGFGAGASVGDLNWIGTNPNKPNNTGSEPTYQSDDANISFDDVTLPTNLGTPTLRPNNKGVNPTITASGYYQINNLGSLDIQANSSTPVNVTLWLPNGINYSSGNVLNVGTNCTCTIYLGWNVSMSGNASINNATENALNLSIYALPAVTSISFGGNSTFTGTIYAPEADVNFGGSGNSTYDIVGSIDAKSVSMNGHPNFHYDENLAHRGPGRGFVPTTWLEVVKH